jgi:hypothetical protein
MVYSSREGNVSHRICCLNSAQHQTLTMTCTKTDSGYVLYKRKEQGHYCHHIKFSGRAKTHIMCAECTVPTLLRQGKLPHLSTGSCKLTVYLSSSALFDAMRLKQHNGAGQPTKYERGRVQSECSLEMLLQRLRTRIAQLPLGQVTNAFPSADCRMINADQNRNGKLLQFNRSAGFNTQ